MLAGVQIDANGEEAGGGGGGGAGLPGKGRETDVDLDDPTGEGFARARGRTDVTMSFKGTPSFMAPEALLQQVRLNWSTMCYALCVERSQYCSFRTIVLTPFPI